MSLIKHWSLSVWDINEIDREQACVNKQNSNSTHARPLIVVRPYCACEYFYSEHILVKGMQDAEFTIHDCNTKIKPNVILSEELYCFMDTSQLRNTQFYLVWHKAVFGCQIPQSNIQFNSCRKTSIMNQNTEYSH